MEPFKAVNFFKVGGLLDSLAYSYASTLPRTPIAKYIDNPDSALDEALPEGEKVRIQLNLDLIGKECQRIALTRSTQYAWDIIQQFSQRKHVTYREIATLLRELEKHIRWDMEKELFMYIPADRASYYHNPKLLSPAAVNGFPIAGEEITLSGDCYAAGCWTASLTHSMRALEKPIHAVADAIGGINLPKAIELSQWGEIHREIDNKVKALRNNPLTAARDEEIAFYSKLNLEFGYFNDIWRRFVSHSRKTYDADQAKSAMGHVIAFIDKASEKGLKELP